jgi:integrase
MTEKSSKKAYKGSGANPIKSTIETIPNYPKKLIIFKVESSPYYWSRVYVNGRYSVRSLKTDNRKLAQQAAIKFFTDILVDHRVGLAKPLKSRTFTNVGNDYLETINDGGKTRRYADDKNRFNHGLVPFFAEKDVGEITNADISELIKSLAARDITTATINHYLIVLRKVLKYANNNRLIPSVPNFPRVTGKTSTTKRDYFPTDEYLQLVRTIEEMASDGIDVRGVPVTLEFKYLVQFMVNSFIRPSDLRVLKRSHVTVKTNEKATRAADKNFLLLTHPATKTTDQEVVTMPAAYGVYQSLIKFQDANRDPSKKYTDFVFFPEYSNRSTMMNVAGRIFRAVLKQAGLEREGVKRTLYSLRHTSIMYRVLRSSVGTLELAKNARTSQVMIEKHYTSRFAPIMAVESLHSFNDRPTPAKKTPAKKAAVKKIAPAKKVTPAKKAAPAKRVKASRPRSPA